MSDQKDHYEVLGIDRGASPEAIRNAHRKLARKFHPDLNQDADAATRFNEIQAAYEGMDERWDGRRAELGRPRDGLSVLGRLLRQRRPRPQVERRRWQDSEPPDARPSTATS